MAANNHRPGIASQAAGLADVVILGAGIVGLACAWHALCDGASVLGSRP